MNAEAFEKHRTAALRPLHELYSALFSSRDGVLPVNQLEYGQHLNTRLQEVTDALKPLIDLAIYPNPRAGRAKGRAEK